MLAVANGVVLVSPTAKQLEAELRSRERALRFAYATAGLAGIIIYGEECAWSGPRLRAVEFP